MKKKGLATASVGVVQKVFQLTHTSPIECQLMDRDGEVGGLGSIIRKIGDGFVNLFLRTGEGASLTLNENADPSVRTDLSAAVKTMLPGRVRAQAALVGYSVDIPFRSGSLETGTWQGLYLCDWACREDRKQRTFDVVATVVPSQSKSQRLTVTPPSRGSHDIRTQLSSAAADAVDSSAGSGGLCCMLVRHTSASVVLAETETGGKDMERVLNVLAPERWNNEFFTHTYEGDDDMPGHCKSTLVGASLVVPRSIGSLPRSIGVFLCEHRNCGGWGGGGRRTVSLVSVPGAVPVPLSIGGSSFVGGMASVRSLVGDAVAARCAEVGVRTGVANVCVLSPRAALVVCGGGGGNEELRKDLSGVVVAGSVKGVATEAVETCVAGMLGRSLTLPVCDGHLAIAEAQDLVLFSLAATPSTTAEMLLTVVGSDK